MGSANATKFHRKSRGSVVDLSRLPRLAVGLAVDGSAVFLICNRLRPILLSLPLRWAMLLL